RDRAQADGSLPEVGSPGRATGAGILHDRISDRHPGFPVAVFQFHECGGVRAHVPRRSHAVPGGDGPPGRNDGDAVMKKLLVVIFMAAAWAGGYGYGRWYAKPPAGERKPLYWIDPMHPWYKSDVPGIAPDCNTKLVPVLPGEEARYERRATTMPEGSVQITPEKQQLIGVEYGTVAYETVKNSVRAVARVTLDETKIAKVHSKLEGWIDQVFVDFTGKQVHQGDPLLTIYSPEALATQQEYLLAIKAQHMMHDNPVHEMLGSTENLVAAARKRMELWDIGENQIAGITASGVPLKNLTLTSPISGFVMERNAFAKARIMPETVLYTVADLSRVWVMADVYEYEAA